MSIDTFKASVQYGDWKGTSAADNADQNDASDWLVENGHKESNELLIGIKIFAGENQGKHEDPIFVEFLLVSPGDHDTVKDMIDSSSAPIPVKRIQVDMPLTEFFGLFKRLSIAFSNHGMFDEIEYIYDD